MPKSEITIKIVETLLSVNETTGMLAQHRKQ